MRADAPGSKNGIIIRRLLGPWPDRKVFSHKLTVEKIDA
jgi:hypothetical protein